MSLDNRSIETSGEMPGPQRTLTVREERPAAGGGGGPYPGLRPFVAREQTLFFGREEHVDALIARLGRNRFLAVVGSSGCGKSSLVGAGLIPNLEANALYAAGSRWRVVTIRPGDRPMTRLAEGLYGAGFGNLSHFNSSPVSDPTPDEQFSESEEQEAQQAALRLLRAGFRLGADSLLDLLRQRREETAAGDENLLLMVDQFEEIFRFRAGGRALDRAADRREAEEFVALLLRTARESLTLAGKPDDPRAYVVLTMRSDYLGECQVFSGLPEMLNDAQFLTPRLTTRQLRDAIVGPATVFGAEIERELVSYLLEQAARVVPESDQLPLLQHALMRLWTYQAARRTKEAREADPVVLTLADFKELGGDLGQVLDGHANEVSTGVLAHMAGASPSGERQTQVRDLIAFLFRQITGRVAGRPARMPTEMGVLLDMALAGVAIGRSREAVRDDLGTIYKQFSASGRNFLTSPRFDPEDERSRIDITHEALFRQWTQLQAWMAQEVSAREWYDRLERDAALRKAGHPHLLWNAEALAAAQSAWREAGLPSEPSQAWALRPTASQEQEQGRATTAEDDERVNRYETAIQFLADSHAAEARRVAAEEARRKADEKDKIESVRRKSEQRRVRQLFLAGSLFCVAAVGLLTWALTESGRAVRASARADKAKKSATEAQEQAGLAKELADQAVLRRNEAQKDQKAAEAETASLQIKAKNLTKEIADAQKDVSTAIVARDKALARVEIANQQRRHAELALAKAQKNIHNRIRALQAQVNGNARQADEAYKRYTDYSQRYEQINRSLEGQVKALSGLHKDQLSNVVTNLAEGDILFNSVAPQASADSDQQTLSKALDYYNKAIDAYKSGNSPLGIGLTLLKCAAAYDKMSGGNLPKASSTQMRQRAAQSRQDAVTAFKRALEQAKETQDKNGQIEALGLLTDVYAGLKDTQQQAETLVSLSRLFAELPDKQKQLATLLRLSELYAKLADKTMQRETLLSIARLYGELNNPDLQNRYKQEADALKPATVKPVRRDEKQPVTANNKPDTANNKQTSTVGTGAPAVSDRKPAIVSPPPPLSALDNAVNRYKQADDSDKVAGDLRAVMQTSNNLADRQQAQFYLARFYHRRYEMAGDHHAAKAAYDLYHNYTKKSYAGVKSEWLSDALFYEAIYYLEKHDLEGARRNVNLMNENFDDTVYVDHICWSIYVDGRKDVGVFHAFKTGEIKAAFILILTKHKGNHWKQPEVDEAISELDSWCREHL